MSKSNIIFKKKRMDPLYIINKTIREMKKIDSMIMKNRHRQEEKNEMNEDMKTNIEEKRTTRYFPNVLLLEDSIFNRSTILQSNKNNEVKAPTENNIIPNVWELVDIIKKEEESEKLPDIESNKNICKNCDANDSLMEDPTAGVVVCKECGVINEELLDVGPEWRQYNNDDNRNEGVNRCGCPSNFFFPKFSQGTIISGIKNNRLKIKQKWGSIIYKERRLNTIFEYISDICGRNKIPRIISDSAKIMYKRISDCKHKTGENIGKHVIIRGINLISVVAACVFKACEMNKTPRTVREIAYLFDADEKKITKGIKTFEKIMTECDDGMILENSHVCLPEDYVRRHCPKLKISEPDTELAVNIAYNCCRMKLASDHNTQSIAAGAILAMIQYRNLNVDKKNISEQFGTSDVTISKIYNKLKNYIDILIDNEITDHMIKRFGLSE